MAKDLACLYQATLLKIDDVINAAVLDGISPAALRARKMCVAAAKEAKEAADAAAQKADKIRDIRERLRAKVKTKHLYEKAASLATEAEESKPFSEIEYEDCTRSQNLQK